MSKAIPRFAAGLAVVFALAGAGLGFVEVGSAGAVPTFTVTDTTDAPALNPADGTTCSSTVSGNPCTLRAAIQAADVGGGAVIDVNDGHYTLTISPSGTGGDDITSGDLNISNNVTIVGDVANPGAVVIDGNGSSGEGSRVFNINAETTTFISGVTITNGNPTNDEPIDGLFNGGGILARGPLTLSDSVVTTNENPIGNGAGIEVQDGALTLDSVTVSDNGDAGTAPLDGGGIELATGTSLTDTIENSTISDNSAGQEGAGIDQVDNSTLDVTNTTISGNSVQGIGSNVGGGFSDNSSPSDTFSNDTISSNTAGSGGGVYNDHGVDLTFTDSTISGNVANSSGGGGFELDSNASTVDITGSTISGNSTTGGNGGGIDNTVCDTLNLTNDTIAANTASGGGGGFYGDTSNTDGTCSAGEAVNFLFDTVAANTAGTAGGDLDVQFQITLTVANTIVANGTPTSCLVEEGEGTLLSGGYNLFSGPQCAAAAGTGDQFSTDPQLGSLGNNGGPTQTEVPGTGSPAIGAIPAATCSGTGVSTDQRGNARGAGTNGSCTVGSVEVAIAPPTFNPNGYRMVANEGGIFDFGLNFNGSLANNKLNAPIVGIANSPGPNGYLMVGSDGGVFALGGANYYGSLCCNALPSPIAAIAATPSEDGYWLAAQNGKISNFGNTPALLSVQVPPGAHIVGMASTNDGKGLWLTDNLGDVYAVGDALYLGGMGGIHLNAPVVGIAAAANGQGYVLAASDGGTFNFGVGFFGSVPGSLAPGQHLVAPIVGIAVTHSGNGYWMVGADGGLFNYGDAPFLGSIYTAIDGTPLNGPIVGIQHLGAAPV